MKILAIDTSSRFGSVALAEGEETIAQHNLNIELTHAERLLPGIETILRQAGWAVDDLEGLALTIGPGSFTGLRIGLATMKGFAQAKGLPLVGVSTLDALSYNACCSERPVAAALDARRGEIFAKVVRFSGGKLAGTLFPEKALAPKDFCGALEEFGDCLLVGDGFQTYRPLFEEGLKARAHFSPLPLSRVEAKWVAWMALPRLRSGDGKEGLALKPNYLRKSDAEQLTPSHKGLPPPLWGRVRVGGKS